MVSLPPTFPSSPSPNVRAVLAFLKCHESAHSESAEKNREVKAALLASNMEHHILPRSLGQPPRGRDDAIAFSAQLLGLLTDFTVTIQEIVESSDAVVVHASSLAKSITGNPYANEYILLFHFVASPDDDPDELPKITLVKEFVDTEFSKRFFKAERERIAAAAAQK